MSEITDIAKTMKSWWNEDDDPFVHRALDEIIRIDQEQVPTIEPKQGEWETVFMSEATGWDISVAGRDPIYGHRCSICKEETFVNDVGEEMLTNFCPNCGSRMRGGKDD